MKLNVKVTANAKKFQARFENGILKVRVRSPPEGGRANEELVKKLSKLLGRAVSITSGFKSREKEVFVEGSREEEVVQKVNSLSSQN